MLIHWYFNIQTLKTNNLKDDNLASILDGMKKEKKKKTEIDDAEAEPGAGVMLLDKRITRVVLIKPSSLM